MDDTIKQLVSQRRVALDGEDDGRRAWGLALSGGGLRSTAFCLGMLKALAASKVLLKFDLVSTVGGGGFVGATYGRLCDCATTPDDIRKIEQAFANVENVRFGWWLRSNGRYLIPSSSRDALLAAVTSLRNFVGTHIEIAVSACLIGLALASFNLIMWDIAFQVIDLDSIRTPSPLIVWATQLPSLWATLSMPLFLSAVLSHAYWVVRDRISVLSIISQIVMWSVLVAGAALIGPTLITDFGGTRWIPPALVAFGSCVVLAQIWVLLRSPSLTPAKLREELNHGLLAMAKFAVLVLLLGVLDLFAWHVAVQTTRQEGAIYGLALLIAALLLRSLHTKLSAGTTRPLVRTRRVASIFLSLAGVGLAFCIAAWWIAAIYKEALFPIFQFHGLNFTRGWVWVVTLTVLVGTYALLTGRNLAFLNLSSHHMFVRARVVRAYLGAASSVRQGAAPTDILSNLEPPRVEVGAVEAHDDVPQVRYAPHRQGGPVHLINLSVNQSANPTQRLFSADGRQLPLTVGPLGWMQVGGVPWAQARDDEALTLGTWTAISAAAFAPEIGALKRVGISMLSVLGGLRQGFWWDSAAAGIVQAGATTRSYLPLLKTRLLLREMVDSFPTSSSAYWHLTGAEAQENTGVYALLRQEAELIVLADCGLDQDYEFSDVIALSRLARRDLQAEFVFMKPRAGISWPGLPAFGSLKEVGSDSGQSCLALVQIRYASGLQGTLIIVKPNVFDGVPVDLVQFKRSHQDFPQEADTDRYFEYAQWESYVRLSERICANLNESLLRHVLTHPRGLFEPDEVMLDEPRSTTVSSGDAKDGLRKRVNNAAAVTATIGVGTVVTATLAIWQNVDNRLKANVQRIEQEQRLEESALKEVTDRWAKIRLGDRDAVSQLATALISAEATLCRRGAEGNFIEKYPRFVRFIDDAKMGCASIDGESRPPSCVDLLDARNGIRCLEPRIAPPCAPRYWARDYSGDTPAKNNCSALPWPGLMGELFSRLIYGDASEDLANASHMSTLGVCDAQVIYISMFGPAFRDMARSWRAPWRALGATVTPMEDVLVTSAKRGTLPPTGFSQPSVVIENETQRRCALALVKTAKSPTGEPWVITLNPLRYSQPPESIMVWLPRAGPGPANR
ncbi:hypothetical protein [Variovorax fucosicus]|uniref:hypothetical protein n=1 Tax=Variovorax fucosicus TaxID=3053517 RepID=UPI00257502E4|nr:hypothetical protein [Variovorax sp. J22G47]MDM0059007.1 hypothetical protein [Variovorax sp. J22G47]